MHPTFILTRAFAISSLFVGAAPLAQAAPIYATTTCVSGTSRPSCSLSSIWSFFAALIPTVSSPGPVDIFNNAYPEESFHFATHSSEPPAAGRETVAVVVVVEETCADGSCGGSLYKRDDVEVASRESKTVEERADDDDIITHEPAELVDRDANIIIREPAELVDRDANIIIREPEPLCNNIAFCKRESESK
ncbi:uncharacterized protein PHACADRAFT_259876 [Phanerochaete carnosa HHB-10118-sp]|uniref:Uncharacterized protein n=1 Tax=Phanerochaete carnosa (strain HHB-10118-sp) TaxID=650164 RepID=K5VPT4_PHACS|nr:uncharacterized protein PHACADRAFT_259876 [Phanerochaete carnosa HHB-10118-sp]EKM53468.1 hypothetical protein PHACADRAFT_259876 [Phanerochaete carnosa HHB-10118-sp]